MNFVKPLSNFVYQNGYLFYFNLIFTNISQVFVEAYVYELSLKIELTNQ